MSTKTTFKRIALVAVAALTLGSFSAVSATAAPSASYKTMYDTTNGYQVVGGQATLTVLVDTSTVTSVVVSGVGSVVSATAVASAGIYVAPTVSGTPTTGSFQVTGSTATGKADVVLTSAVAGTQTITMTPYSTVNGTAGTAVTKTITWVASTTIAPSVTNSTSFLGATTVAASADVAVTADKAAAQVANVAVTVKDANTNALFGQTLTATISGPGLIKWNQSSATQVGSLRAESLVLSSSQNTAYLGVSADGTAGVATITITAGTTVLSTETVTFTGAATAYAVTPMYANLLVGANGTDASSTAYGYAVKVTDANGNAVVNGTTVYATSATTTVATITASQTTTSGYAYFAVTGVAAGTSVITFGNSATSATVSATTTAKVTSIVASTVTLAFDKTEYTAGEKMVLTLTAKNADGEGVADAASYTAFLGTASANVALQGTLLATAPAFIGGVATYTLYAPLAAGPVVVTVKTGTSANLATAAQGLTLIASATVLSDGVAQAAADAAAEATDAANAATDAANAAAEAADAATAAAQDAADAVAALSVAVTEMVSALKKQITALTNLVIKIQKKVKA